MATMPALFVSHGAPNMVISDLPARQFMEHLGDTVGTPKAIIIVSAHFETPGVAVVSDPKPEMIYDFGGFEPVLYSMQYPAPGDPALALKVFTLLENAGFEPREVAKRGYDHGAWTPLKLAFPKADIPVVQVSIDPSRDARYHFALGKALAPLREEGVLVIGSGHITHNLRAFFMRGRDPNLDSNIGGWVDAFIEWMRDKAEAGDVEALLDWERQAPFAAENHPEAEHLMPFFVALGAGAGGKAERIHHSKQMGFFAYDHYAIH
jgi:4,5-DOPA dioxygenase extradiol